MSFLVILRSARLRARPVKTMVYGFTSYTSLLRKKREEEKESLNHHREDNSTHNAAHEGNEEKAARFLTPSIPTNYLPPVPAKRALAVTKKIAALLSYAAVYRDRSFSGLRPEVI